MQLNRATPTTRSTLRRWGRRLALLALLPALFACGSAPPLPPKQVLEYERQTAVGLEKHRHGYVGQARTAFLRALGHAELDDSHERIAAALINLGGMELLLDQADAAGQAYARAVREARAGKLTRLEWQAQSGLAEATRRLGQPAKALELYAARPDPGQALAEPVRLAADIGQALAMADQGQTDAALTQLQKAELAAQARPQPDTLWPAILHARARILLAATRHEEALAAAEQALHLDRALHHPPSVGESHRLMAQILGAMQRDVAAQDHRLRAAVIFSQTGQLDRYKSLIQQKQ